MREGEFGMHNQRIDRVQAAGVIAKLKQTIKAPLVAHVLQKYKDKEPDPIQRGIILKQLQKAVAARDITDKSGSKLDQKKFHEQFDARASLQFYINECSHHQLDKVKKAELQELRLAFGHQAHEFSKQEGQETIPFEQIQRYFWIASKIMMAIRAADMVDCLETLEKAEVKLLANGLNTTQQLPEILVPLPMLQEESILGFDALESDSPANSLIGMEDETQAVKSSSNLFYMVIISADGINSRCDKLPKTRGQATVGRHATNTIIISDGIVSRYHLIIKRLDEKTFSVTDLATKNGTLLNHLRLQPHVEVRWKEGEIIKIGRTALILRQE
jgi:hypothetical protein